MQDSCLLLNNYAPIMDEQKNIFSKWLIVQAYKHDGSLHRQWSPGYVVLETDEYWALATKSSLVTEDDGRRWMTKENAIFLLFKKQWLNVICMFKEAGGICYYTNIASPTILDDGYLRYVDYDLDLKLFPDKVIKSLDEQEFLTNAKRYGYSPDLIKAIRRSFQETREAMEKGVFPFADSSIESLYQKFLAENQPFIPRHFVPRH